MKYYSKGIFFLVILLLLANGCAKKPEQEKRDKNDVAKEKTIIKGSRSLTKEEAEKALRNVTPVNGSVLTGDKAIIHWKIPVPAEGTVKYRKKGETEWKTISSDKNTVHIVSIKGIEPGEEYEYLIIINAGGESVESNIRSFSTAKGIVFTEEEYDFTINRDYEQVRSIRVINNDDKPRRIKARIKDHDSDLALGFVGEGSTMKEIELASGEEKALEFILHAQDARNEKYEYVIDVNGIDMEDSVVDNAIVKVTVKPVNFDIKVSKGEVSQFTLATTLKIVNGGDVLSDFTISTDEDLKGKIQFNPQVVHARFTPGEAIKIEAIPVLFPGIKKLSGNIIFSGAWQEKVVPIEFIVPEGKKVYCAVTRSTCSTSASSSSCTNRGKFDDPINTYGNGPLPPDSPYRSGDLGENRGPSPWENKGWSPLPVDQGPTPIKNSGAPILRPGESFPPIDYIKHSDGNYYNKDGDKLPVDPTPFEKSNRPLNKFNDKLKKLKKGYVDPNSTGPGYNGVYSYGGGNCHSAGIRGGIIRKPISDIEPGLEFSNLKYPMVVFQGEDKAVVWHDYLVDNQEVFFVKIVPEGPIQVERITNSEGESRWPWIAGDVDKDLFITWEDGRDGAKREIYYKRSENGGEDWSEDMRITGHGKGAYDPIIGVSDSDLFLAWEDGRGGIYLRTSSDNGKTWAEEARIVDGMAAWPQFTGNKDELWMAWEAYEDKDEVVYAANSIDKGKTWSKPFKVSGSSKQAGEPSILVLHDGSVCVAWRDNRDDESEIYFRKSNDGENWSKEVRLTHDTAYSEYPFFTETEKSIIVSFYSPVNNVNCMYNIISSDGGDTWQKPLRVPALEDNVKKVYFITSIKLPWDRSYYPRHSMKIKINGNVITTFTDVVPAEGKYIFEVDPEFLNYNPGGLAKNIIEFETNGLSGGSFFRIVDYKIVQSRTYQEVMVVASSQAEADRVAEILFSDRINHDHPNIGIYANKVNGFLEAVNGPGKITLEVEVMNIGAGEAKDVEVYIIKGEKVAGEKLSNIVKIDTIPPQGSKKVKLEIDYDGSCFMATVAADCSNKDFDLNNNRSVFRCGYSDTGTIQVLTEGERDVTVFVQATGKEVKKFKSNEKEILPIGLYKVAILSEEERVHERVSIKGGEETLVVDGVSGDFYIKALETYPVQIIPDGENAPLLETKCNQTVSLPPGFYRVEMDCGDFGIITLKDILINVDEITSISGGPGSLYVRSIGNYDKIEIIDLLGEKKTLSTNWGTTVPVGIYTLKVKEPGSSEEMIDMGEVTVIAGEKTWVYLKGYGKLNVRSIDWGDPVEIYNDKGELEQTITTNNDTVLPVGTYNVKVKIPGPYEGMMDLGEATVTEGETTWLKLGGYGKLQVKAGNYGDTVEIINNKNEIEQRIERNEDTVLPVGTYTVKAKGKTFKNVIIKEDDHMILRDEP